MDIEWIVGGHWLDYWWTLVGLLVDFVGEVCASRVLALLDVRYQKVIEDFWLFEVVVAGDILKRTYK